MKKIMFATAMFVFLLLPTLAKAAEYKVPDETGNLTIGSGEIHKNLYATGGDVKIESNTSGDLVILGGTLTIDGNVEESLIAAGGTITISGSTGRSVRVAGGTITISGTIGEDLLVAGGTVNITDKATIGGDLAVSGGTVNMAGNVSGNLSVNGGAVKISGSVGGNVNAKFVDTLTVTDSARINGNLSYSSSKEGTISQSAIDGTVSFHKIDKIRYDFPLMSTFYSLLGMIFALIVIVYLLPKSSKTIVEGALENFWGKIGIGLIALITVPITAIIISAVTVGVGFSLSAILGLLYIIVLVLAGVLIPLVTGHLILSKLKKGKPELDWLTVIVGAIATVVIGRLPIIGPAFLFTIFLLILGQLSSQIWNLLKKER